MGKDLVQAAAGTSAGAFSTALLYPLDLVKVRLEAYQGRISIANCVRKIMREEGWKALYRGLTPSIIGSSVSWGCYFTLYENAKNRYTLYKGLDKNEKLSWSWHLLSACEAGVLTTCLTNPVWLIKTRLQLQFERISSSDKKATGRQLASPGTIRSASSSVAVEIPPLHRDYTGPIDCARRIVMEEGMFALWKGIVPALWLVSHGALQFVMYEELKELFKVHVAGQGKELSSVHFLAMGSLSKVGASVGTYPLQVIKTRLQAPEYLASQYKGFFDCAFQMVRQEGIRSLYKGIVPNVLRVTPSSALTFFAYENIVSVLKPLQDNAE